MTPAARSRWEDYLRGVHESLLGHPGIDAREVRESLEDHLDELLADHGDPIDEAVLSEALDLLGPVEPESRSAGMEASIPPGVAPGTAVLFLLGLAVFPWTGPLALLPAYLASRTFGPRATGPGRWLVWSPALMVALLLALGVPSWLGLAAGAALAEFGVSPLRAFLLSTAVGFWLLTGVAGMILLWPRLGRALLWPLTEALGAREARWIAMGAAACGVAAGFATWLVG
jgi:hypothetical protein